MKLHVQPRVYKVIRAIHPRFSTVVKRCASTATLIFDLKKAAKEEVGHLLSPKEDVKKVHELYTTPFHFKDSVVMHPIRSRFSVVHND